MTTGGDDGNDTPIDMSGGSVRIGFPGHWAVSKNYVRVELVGELSCSQLIYETGNDGGFINALDTDLYRCGRETLGADTSNVELNVDGKYIIVTLDSRWRASAEPTPTKLACHL